ncbi:hypothetical protein Avbf_06840, partial [Armadillidium vulgare]
DNKNILNIHGAGLPGQHGQQSQQQQPKSSISGMLSDFTKALGLGSTSPTKEEHHKTGLMANQLRGQTATAITTTGNTLITTSDGVITSQGILTKQGIVTSLGIITSQGQLIQGQPQLITSQVGGKAVITSTGQIINQIPNHIATQIATTLPQTVMTGQVIQNPQLVNSAGQPLIIQQMTPAQQLQLQQMQLQHQAQHLKKIRGRDQASMLQQQAAIQQQLHPGKISPTPLRRDLSSGLAGIQQQLGNKLGRLAASVPTAALLSQSTISTSDSKQRIGAQTGESALTSLQRARLRSSSDQLVSPEDALLGLNPQLALLSGTPSTPAGTPRGLRDDSSDTMSETDSQKSLRSRRKLPHLPPDQEAVTLPTHKKYGFNTKDRVR